MWHSRDPVLHLALPHVDGEGFYLQPDPRLRILYPHFYGGRRLLFMASTEKLIVSIPYPPNSFSLALLP